MNKQNDWRERFDEEFLGFKSDEIMDSHYGLVVSNEVGVAKIKQFIQKELDRAFKEGFEAGSKKKK